MGIFDKFKKKKEVKKPNLIVFEKENIDNDYANFELKIKPRISIDDGFPQEAYYVVYESYGFTYRDHNHRPYRLYEP